MMGGTGASARLMRTCHAGGAGTTAAECRQWVVVGTAASTTRRTRQSTGLVAASTAADTAGTRGRELAPRAE